MLSRVLSDAATAMTAAAHGDLKSRMIVRGKGHFAALAIRFNAMIDSFATVVDGIRAAGSDLTSSASALSGASTTMTTMVGATNAKLDQVAMSASQVNNDISEVAAGTGQ